MSGTMLPDLEALATAFKELKRVLHHQRAASDGGAARPDVRVGQPAVDGAGSLPANLAPAGATVTPEADLLPGDDEFDVDEDGDGDDDDGEDEGDIL